ncbi:WD40 repeat domain-containing protein [Candidatus Dependentiae bacterium]|nr:WD40 repeat domain-containing protein [Candidatus Dependentiae bacterium]
MSFFKNSSITVLILVSLSIQSMNQSGSRFIYTTENNQKKAQKELSISSQRDSIIISKSSFDILAQQNLLKDLEKILDSCSYFKNLQCFFLYSTDIFPHEIPQVIIHIFTRLLMESCLECNFELLKEFKGHSKNIHCAAFRPDGKTLVTGSFKNACLWDVDSGNQLIELPNHYARVSFVRFTSEGILTKSRDGMTYLWNASSGELINKCKGPLFKEEITTFSSNKKLVCSGANNKIVQLQDTQTGEPITTFTGHSECIWSVALSPDEQTVLTGSEDSTACLWDAQSGNLLLTLTQCGGVGCVAFSPDGKTIFTGPFNNDARLWTMIPCDATHWIFNNASLLQGWLLVKANQEKRATGSFIIEKGSLEYHLFIQLPSYVQEYVRHWFSLSIKGKIENALTDDDTPSSTLQGISFHKDLLQDNENSSSDENSLEINSFVIIDSDTNETPLDKSTDGLGCSVQ